MTKPKRNSYCHFCGTKYLPVHTSDGIIDMNQAYPFVCVNPECMQTTYLNPLPVVIVAIPVYHRTLVQDYHKGYLAVRRNIEPIGALCLAGGYIDGVHPGSGKRTETWEEAAIREVWEETGLRIKYVTQPQIISASNFVCILCISNPVYDTEIDFSFSNGETQELVLLTKPKDNEPHQLAFPVQTEFLSTLKYDQAI